MRSEEDIHKALRWIRRNEETAEKERAHSPSAELTNALLSFEGATVALLWVLEEVETPLAEEFFDAEEGQ
jgi:hypothetical protein